MIVNVAVQELLNCKPGDEIVTCKSEDYYNNINPRFRFKEVIDIVKDNGKLIILTR